MSEVPVPQQDSDPGGFREVHSKAVESSRALIAAVQADNVAGGGEERPFGTTKHDVGNNTEIEENSYSWAKGRQKTTDMTVAVTTDNGEKKYVGGNVSYTTRGKEPTDLASISPAKHEAVSITRADGSTPAVKKLTGNRAVAANEILRKRGARKAELNAYRRVDGDQQKALDNLADAQRRQEVVRKITGQS